MASFISKQEDFLYLATYLDVFTRKRVGFSLGATMETSLILFALEMAIGRQPNPAETLVSHSDRGSQNASQEYRKKLEEFGITRAPAIRKKASIQGYLSTRQNHHSCPKADSETGHPSDE